ncbi:MAG: ATP-binding cassette domain-containing protein [Euryarchaeota archaeon]|nr:ATP-binding cassette domain-containing protein [Euryarchaeota archaeon]MBT4156245.1 ATP-binding cassette domain-containing protein [Euryarchaeota archaeon]MBT4475606.1 ATP-binding cassette domain-containing protein [Euryarchaeota archaeon]MBT4793962.1 ATP-binding cassette domain-containing protein [Euryarchaeota archaeon]MBT5639254.1 ATP-binding cassette domain-containing protein [Euryarchaeota archaeon]
MSEDSLLKIQNLKVHFDTLEGPVEALHDVNLEVKKGQIMGVVGESGCGKSVTSLTSIGLATCIVDEGSIKYDGKEMIFHESDKNNSLVFLSKILPYIAVLIFFPVGFVYLMPFMNDPLLGFQIIMLGFGLIIISLIIKYFIHSDLREHEKFMRFIRGNEISMIFQEPMTALNPLYTVEKQIYEVMKTHNRLVDSRLSQYDRIFSSLKSPFRFMYNWILSDRFSSIFFSILLLTYLLTSCMGPNLISSWGTRFVVIFYASAEVSISCTNYTDELISYCFLLIPFGILRASIKSSMDRKEDFRKMLVSIPYVSVILLLILWYDSSLFLGDLWHEELEISDNNWVHSAFMIAFYSPIISSLFVDFSRLEEVHRFLIIRSIPFTFTLALTYAILLWTPNQVVGTIVALVMVISIPCMILIDYLQLDPAHRGQVVKILEDVQIPNPGAVITMYPHELSGGMRQRVMIAMMMSCEPKLLIADEPTTALDVTIQAQILHLMRDLRDRKGTSIMLITHDLGVIAELCDSVSVMYAGSVVETGTIEDILANPRMPYTIGLLHSIPKIVHSDEREGRTSLPIIPGQVPDPNTHFDGCRFHPRCPFADDLCRSIRPEMIEVSEGHYAACHHTDLTIISEDVESSFDIFSKEFEGVGGEVIVR